MHTMVLAREACEPLVPELPGNTCLLLSSEYPLNIKGLRQTRGDSRVPNAPEFQQRTRWVPFDASRKSVYELPSDKANAGLLVFIGPDRFRKKGANALTYRLIQGYAIIIYYSLFRRKSPFGKVSLDSNIVVQGLATFRNLPAKNHYLLNGPPTSVRKACYIMLKMNFCRT